MNDLCETIELLIEEQYLADLGEDEIRENFGRFVELCVGVIRAHVARPDRAERLLDHLAQTRTHALSKDIAAPEEAAVTGTERERLVVTVARQKRRMLRAMEACDPALLPLIEQARYRGAPAESGLVHRPARKPHQARHLEIALGLIAAGAALLAIQLLLFL